MSWYSKADKRPVAWANNRDDNTDATIVIIHLTASEATSQYGYFNTSRKACSSFHIARSGKTEQYIDTDKISAAEYEGSDDAISIETQGADANGRWDKEQAEALAQLLAWIHLEHGLPLVLKKTSRPDERGIGYHRLGIEGNFPTSPEVLRGRNQRGYVGEEWSTSFGKVCPGDARILQLRDEVLPRAIELAGANPKEEETKQQEKPRPVWRGAMGWVKLRPGSGGKDVRELQAFLNDFRAGLEVDGKFGPATKGAVVKWQKDRKLEADGIVGANTQSKMKTAKKPATPAKPKPSIPQIKLTGVWGRATTKRIQEVLGAPFVDGKISRQNSVWRASNPGLQSGWDWNGGSGGEGSQTIKLIQARVGVKQDGKIGPKTITAMQKHFGTPQDGRVSAVSTMVTAMQKRLNAGKF